MTAPPGTSPAVDQYHSLPEQGQVGASTPTPKREAIRFLMRELGLSGAACNRLYNAYLLDLADEAAELRWIADQNQRRRECGAYPTRIDGWLDLIAYDTGHRHHLPGWAKKIRCPRGVEPR